MKVVFEAMIRRLGLSGKPEVHKATLAIVLAKAGSGMRFNEHIEGGGWRLAARAQQRALPVIGLLSSQRRAATCGSIISGAEARPI